ncbi:MAG: PIN domain-containing protein [archaeon]|nr:PIN domain-containing protein [archaeon]
MNLIDTNIVLELLLEREKAESVRDFFQRIPASKIFVSDFSLHSIGIFLLKIEMPEVLRGCIEDLIIFGGVQVSSLNSREIIDVVEIANRFHLDFDDAYQYTVAEKHDLQIVSFDTDFDRTERGRKTPDEVVQ